MNQMVFSVFKTIAFAIIFVFVWDTVFYLYRVNSLNTRVENIASSMQHVVMQNNYMPEGEADMFQTLFVTMANTYNNRTSAGLSEDLKYYSRTDGSTTVSGKSKDDFILYMDWNYAKEAKLTNIVDATNCRIFTQMGHDESNSNSKMTYMDSPTSKGTGFPDYGDIVMIQLRFMVAQPTWNFMRNVQYGANKSITAGGGDANGENQRLETSEAFTHTFEYVYYVPCLRYRATWQ